MPRKQGRAVVPVRGARRDPDPRTWRRFGVAGEPREVPPGLTSSVAEVFRAAQPAGAQLLTDLLTEAQAQRPPRPEDDVLRTFAWPWLALLDAIADGAKLTPTGSLPSAVVRAVHDLMPPAPTEAESGENASAAEGRASGSSVRSAHSSGGRSAASVNEIRRTADELGLIRVVRGRLVPTKKAGIVQISVEALPALIADRLPAGRREIDRHASVVLLLVVAAVESDDDRAERDARVARVLTSIGWHTEAGAPVRSADVPELLRPTTVLLRDPAPDVERFLARLALGLAAF